MSNEYVSALTVVVSILMAITVFLLKKVIGDNESNYKSVKSSTDKYLRIVSDIYRENSEIRENINKLSKEVQDDQIGIRKEILKTKEELERKLEETRISIIKENERTNKNYGRVIHKIYGTMNTEIKQLRRRVNK